MKVNPIVKILFACVVMLMPIPVCSAQTMADDFFPWAQSWQHAFSQEGRKEWRPEITARLSPCFITTSHRATIGVRIDRKHTLGIMAAYGHTYIDANPSTIDAIQLCAYKRYYMYPGKRGIIAFYSDLFIGVDRIYDITGKYSGPNNNEEVVTENVGDIRFYAAWEPGIRLRPVCNFHIFLGPSISVNGIGLHLGIGL